jgi:hypothetical protein
MSDERSCGRKFFPASNRITYQHNQYFSTPAQQDDELDVGDFPYSKIISILQGNQEISKTLQCGLSDCKKPGSIYATQLPHVELS